MAPASAIEGSLRLLHTTLDRALDLSLVAKLFLRESNFSPTTSTLVAPLSFADLFRQRLRAFDESLRAVQSSPFEALVLLADTSVCPHCHTREPYPPARPSLCTHPFHGALAIIQETPVSVPPPTPAPVARRHWWRLR